MNITAIKNDLKDIKYYYSRKAVFDKAAPSVGSNAVIGKIAKYNEIACTASPKLYDIYVMLYVENHTQESLSELLGFTPEYIQMLNSKLVKYFQDNL